MKLRPTVKDANALKYYAHLLTLIYPAIVSEAAVPALQDSVCREYSDRTSHLSIPLRFQWSKLWGISMGRETDL